MLATLLLLYLYVALCGSATQFSTHPAVTKLTKLSPYFSPRVKVHWYFPELGYGDYADITRIYTCRHTGEPHRFIYGYSLALTVIPEFAVIYYSAEIDNAPEGHACVQVCAVFDDSLEKCSEPFFFENWHENGRQPSSYPVFWDQNKLFKTYPYTLKISPLERGINVEWYFPKHQTYTFTDTALYTCKFDPADFSISDLRFVVKFKTEHKNIHSSRLSHLTDRWVCVRVCVVSHYQVCGGLARFDNIAIHGTTASPLSPFPTRSSEGATPQGEHTQVTEAGYDLVFDDYEDLEGLLQESGPGMTSLREDVFIDGSNSTASEAHICLPNNLFYFPLLCAVYLLYNKIT